MLNLADERKARKHNAYSFFYSCLLHIRNNKDYFIYTHDTRIHTPALLGRKGGGPPTPDRPT